MNLLFINRLAGTAPGGGENFIFNIIENIKERGHLVYLLTCKPLFRKKISIRVKYPVFYLNIPFLKYIGNNYHIPFPFVFEWFDELIFSWRIFFWVKNFIKHNKIDLIQITVYPKIANIIGKYFKIPIIGRVAGLPDKKFANGLRDISAVISGGDAYIQLKKFGLSNCTNIPPGVREKFYLDLPEENLELLRKQMNIVDKIIITFIGRLNKIKNLPILLQAFEKANREIKDLRLLIIGDGDQKKYLKKISIKLNIEKRIIFVGEKYRDKVIPYYQISDIFILPSKYDNLPQVLNEAMASKLPIIATNVGGIPIQVDDGINGFLIPVNDIESLARKIVLLAKNPILRKQMGERGREKIRKAYSWKKSTDLFEMLCYNIINKK